MPCKEEENKAKATVGWLFANSRTVTGRAKMGIRSEKNPTITGNTFFLGARSMKLLVKICAEEILRCR